VSLESLLIILKKKGAGDNTNLVGEKRKSEGTLQTGHRWMPIFVLIILKIAD